MLYLTAVPRQTTPEFPTRAKNRTAQGKLLLIWVLITSPNTQLFYQVDCITSYRRNSCYFMFLSLQIRDGRVWSPGILNRYEWKAYWRRNIGEHFQSSVTSKFHINSLYSELQVYSVCVFSVCLRSHFRLFTNAVQSQYNLLGGGNQGQRGLKTAFSSVVLAW